MLVGPIVGGLLSSEPRHESTTEYPFALPNIFLAAVYAIAAVGIFFGLEKTLEILHPEENFVRRLWNKLTRLFAGRHTDEHLYSSIDSDDTSLSPVVGPQDTLTSPPASLVSLRLIKKPALKFRRIWTFNVLCTMLAHFIIAGHLGTFCNLWAIFLSIPIKQPEAQHPPIFFNGGLGWRPREVGIAMSSLGAMSVVLKMAIYPTFNDCFGTIKVWRSALFIFPFAYTLAPFLALVASATKDGIWVWSAVSLVLLLFVIGRTGVTLATTLLINECTPHPSVRCTIHTTGTVVGTLSRSFFPIIAFAIFGQGQKAGIAGLGFWCLSGLAFLAVVASNWVREGTNGKEIILEAEQSAESNDILGNAMK